MYSGTSKSFKDIGSHCLPYAVIELMDESAQFYLNHTDHTRQENVVAPS